MSMLRFFCSTPFLTLMWRRVTRRAPDGTRRP
jgi:hypothetical protein